MAHTQEPWAIRFIQARGQPKGVGSLNIYRIGYEQTIAFIPRLMDDGGEESDANAYLIAAAPDLLAALKAIVDRAYGVHFGHCNIETTDLCSCGLGMARAAIAKAEKGG